MDAHKWPKILPPLTDEQLFISNDWMKHWHEDIFKGNFFNLMEQFNHTFPTRFAPSEFLNTLEIGSGLGDHLEYESLSPVQKNHYTAVELRKNMADIIKHRYPDIHTLEADCQQPLPFSDHYFDRIIAIHVLEHLPNLPATIREMYRLCNKERGIFSIVIPCEGGLLYSLARKMSSERLFKMRYQQPYSWFIKREHINTSKEIIHELKPYFETIHDQYFPFRIPSMHMNLAIGLTLKPRQ